MQGSPVTTTPLACSPTNGGLSTKVSRLCRASSYAMAEITNDAACLAASLLVFFALDGVRVGGSTDFTSGPCDVFQVVVRELLILAYAGRSWFPVLVIWPWGSPFVCHVCSSFFLKDYRTTMPLKPQNTNHPVYPNFLFGLEKGPHCTPISSAPRACEE